LIEVPHVAFACRAAASFLLLTGACLLWQARAQGLNLPSAPQPRATGASFFSAGQPFEATKAIAKTREEKRFSRAVEAACELQLRAPSSCG
jgi:hypothetical protein